MSYLKSAPSSLSKYQKSSKTTITITAITKNGTKNALFGYFGQQIWKTIIIFQITILKFAKMQKIVQNKKKANFGPNLPYLDILGCKFEKLLIYLKSALSNLSKCKVSRKNKNPWRYTNADLKMCQYFRRHMKIICW